MKPPAFRHDRRAAAALARRASVLFVCLAAPAWAGTTLTIPNASQKTSSVPVMLQFPVTRTGNTGYDAIIAWHTADGSAVDGLDYSGTSGTFTFPAGGATGTTIPVAIASLPGNADLSFQLVIDSVSTYGSAVSFATAKQSDAGSAPFAIARADLNGDGKLDIVVANSGAVGNTVGVFLNTTTPGSPPTFSAQQTFATGSGPYGVAVADINGDGKPDLITANLLAAGGTVSVLLNQTAPGAASASFAAKQDFPCGAFPAAVSIADFNGDGLADVVVVNQTTNVATVIINTTTPGSTTATFGSPNAFGTGNTPVSVTAADLNGDGRPDLVVGNGSSPYSTSVLFNTTPTGQSTPTFSTQTPLPVVTYVNGVAVADINGDGNPDVIGTDAGAAVFVFLNHTLPGDSTPAFGPIAYFSTGTTPMGVTAADINGDGKPDLVVANFETGVNTVSILRNTTAPGADVPTFATQQPFAAGARPVAVATGDVNADGLVDVLVADYADNRIAVLRNTSTLASATAGFAAQHSFAVNAPHAAIATDIDGDGRPDLVVTGSSAGVGEVSVLANKTAPGAATPAFATAVSFTTADAPQSVTAADFNGDGRPDLATANFIGDSVSVLLNTTAPGGAQSFAGKIDFPDGSANSPVGIAAADLNGDGKPDLVATDYGIGAVSVRINTTAPGADTPTFATVQKFGVDAAPFAVVIADVNGDGKPDLCVANYGGNTASILLNTTTPGSTTPTFAAQQSFGTGGSPSNLAIADLNADGKPDLVTVNEYFDSTISVRLNTTAAGSATMTFAAAQTFSVGSMPYAVAATDVDGDGRPDIVTANALSNDATLLRNTTAPGATIVTFATAQPFGVGSVPGSIAAADLNGDGKPDLVVANTDIGVSGNSASVLLNAQYLPTVVTSPATGTIVHDYLFADRFE